MKDVQTILGSNRTGAAIAPELLEEMVQGTEEFPPTAVGNAEPIGDVRMSYTDVGAPIGSMPAAKADAKTGTGGSQMQLLDKLGERLAFERAGTRLWEAMVAKYDATGGFPGGPTRARLAHIRNEELQHFEMLRACLEAMDADPTAITPSAEVQAVASKGLPAVLTDPRTDLVQCLDAVLVAELVDNDCWPALIELLSDAGYEEQAQAFVCAVESEREHLQCVRMWLAAAQGRSVEAVRDLSAVETETIMAMPAIAALTSAGEAGAADGEEEDDDVDAELELAAGTDDVDELVDEDDLANAPHGAATRGRGAGKQASTTPAADRKRTKPREKKRTTARAKAEARGKRSR